jgi:hypothetical protein
MNKDTYCIHDSAKRFRLFLVLSLLTVSHTYSQSKTFYTKQDVVEDINKLVEDIEEIHPAPFHSIEKSDFERRVEAFKNEIPDTISKIAAWKKYYKILALLKEGHCYFLPPIEEIGDYLKFP